MPPKRGVKRESTSAFGGLPTPGASLYSGTVSPKREIESIDLSLSDDPEEEPVLFRSHHGLPSEEALSEYNLRSTSVSTRLSAIPRRDPPPHPASQPRSSNTTPRKMGSAALPRLGARGLEYLGKKRNFMMNGMSDLQEYGLQHVVSFPENVLVGDQSAGKSSVMGNLTEVRLPRAQGICTKCPANITTSTADTWSCRVSLRQSYRYDNSRRRIDARSVKKSDPYPPWIAQDIVIKEFVTLTDKSKLEDAIMWAQLALLNHDEDHTAFIPDTGHRTDNGFKYERENAVAKFSPNLIAIEISGPRLPALSFYDLPGVFSVAPDEDDQYLANVIQNLVEEYIRRPNALIICVLAMKTDPSNSKTLKLIQDCRAKDRTVGVLTNPDHLHHCHPEYERILQNRAHHVKHGYFVTKQPGETSQIGDGPNYHEIAREQEEKYFNEDKLWANEWKEFRPRCGTKPIQDFLSLLFAKQVVESIPRLTEQINERTKEVNARLRLYPDLPDSERKPMVMDALSKFSRDAVAVMKGDNIGTVHRIRSFRTDFAKLSEQFSAVTTHGKPRISLNHPLDIEREKTDRIEIDLLSDDEDEDEEPIVDRRNNKRSTMDSPLNAKKQRMSDGSSVPRTPEANMGINGHNRSVFKPENTPSELRFRPNSQNGPGPFSGTIFEPYSNLGGSFSSLNGIREEIKLQAHSGLPDIVDSKVYDELCIRSIIPWKGPLEAFVDKTFSMVRNQLEKILEDSLRVHGKTDLPVAAKKHLHELLDAYANKQKLFAQEVYEQEIEMPYTLNKSTLMRYRKTELDELTRVRRERILKLEVDHYLRINPKKKPDPSLSREERAKIIDKLKAEVKEDELLTKKLNAFNSEMEVIAYVRAYYLLASQRFVDDVCKSFYAKFFKNVRDGVPNYLESKLGVNSPDGEQICRTLLKEDDSSDRTRRELKAEKEKLAGFAARLDRLVQQLDEPDEDEADTDTDAGAVEVEEDDENRDHEMTEGDGSEATIVAETVSNGVARGRGDI